MCRLAILPLCVTAAVPTSAVHAQRTTPAVADPARPLTFRITYDAGLQPTPYTGRVYVMFAEPGRREPRFGPGWVDPSPVFAVDVDAWAPGKPLVVDDHAMFHPTPLAELPRRAYTVQAVMRRSPDHPKPGTGVGDLYSEAKTVTLTNDGAAISLNLDRVVKPRPFRETERVKEVLLTSKLLSKFHGRDIRLRAGVLLPEGWTDDPRDRYPILYMIPGFGGGHRMVQWLARMPLGGATPHRVIIVVPNASCYRGHSVFADSENNGPWGRALIDELIPAIEARFHAADDGAPVGRHRYVTGVSSGGWSSLWLQITYPDAFNGCWSMAPDPVDFRDFQRINLYEPGANMYRDKTGARRPLMRRGDDVAIWYEDFVHMEDVMGPGGQIHSFEAVFGHRADNGAPSPLFDRKTGRVDTAVARSWQRYDIRLVLERGWSTLGPKLAGKLHIYAGGQDDFYLDGAVRLLKDALAGLGSDADVRVIEDAGHGPAPGAFRAMLDTITNNFTAQPPPPTEVPAPLDHAPSGSRPATADTAR